MDFFYDLIGFFFGCFLLILLFGLLSSAFNFSDLNKEIDYKNKIIESAYNRNFDSYDDYLNYRIDLLKE